MKTTFKMSLLGAALAVVTTASFAGNMDTLAAEKDAEVKVKLIVPKLVNVTAPRELELNFDGQNNPTDTKGFCIASNMGTDVPVHLKITDSTAPTQPFVLKNSDATKKDHNEVAFTMTYIGGGVTQEIQPGTQYDNIKGAAWLADCNGGQAPSSLKVDVQKDSLLNSYNGTYNATLTMTVSAE